MISRPASAMSGAGACSDPWVTGGTMASGSLPSAAIELGGMTTSLAFTAPMSAMKRPIPTLIARRRSSGIALITASRTPTSTSASTTRPFSTTSPIADCHEPVCPTT